MRGRTNVTVALLCLTAVGLIANSGCPPTTMPPPDGMTCPEEIPVSEIALRSVVDGLESPVAMAVPGDDSGRLFIVEQRGQILIVDSDDNLLAQPFLDIEDRLVPVRMTDEGEVRFDERGLLGLAFHPDYTENGRFFVYYSGPKDEDDPEEFDSELRLSEFQVSVDDPNVADADSERLLFEINDPQFNHNGGQLAFGPGGHLYIGVGDGGGADDLGVGHTEGLGNGQDKTNLLGAILRIDVDSGDPFGIPADNPYADGVNGAPEIFAFGMRNPWRFSFDDQGRLFVADVGQNLYEEVNIVTNGGNYGWRIREGFHCFDADNPDMPPEDCPEVDADGDPLLDPILEYPHPDEGVDPPFGISVTGGYVYRGTAMPCLEGEYLFGDWSTSFGTPDGSLFAARQSDDGTWEMRSLTVAGDDNGRIDRFILSFGEDEDGELYVLTTESASPQGTTGEVFRLIEAP